MKKNPIKAWFEGEAKTAGLTPTRFAQDLDVPYQTVWNWLSDNTRPAANVLYKIHRRTKIEPLILLEWAADVDDGL